METSGLSKDSGHSSTATKLTLTMIMTFVIFIVFYSLVSRPSLRTQALKFASIEHTDIIGQGQHDPEKQYVQGEGAINSVLFEMQGLNSHMGIVDQIQSSEYTCGNESQNTSLKNSKMYISHVNESTGHVDVSIETYDHDGNRKSTGGDIMVVWAVQKKLVNSTFSARRIVGSVIDHMNGSYSGKLIFYWGGMYTVYTKVLSIFRTQCLRLKAMFSYGNSVFSLPNPYGIFFTFRNESRLDMTRCGPIDYIYGYKDLCNFTSFNFDYSYYCGKPGFGLRCSDVEIFNMRKYDLAQINVSRLNEDIIYNPGWGKLAPQTVNISTQNKVTSQETAPFCFALPTVHSWNISPSHVYIDRGRWNHVSCKTKPQTGTMARRCLTNKKVFLIGDSTVRQYVEAIGSLIKERLTYYPFYVTLFSVKDNINVTWRKHELPFHNIAQRNPYHVNSTANQIHTIAHDSTIADKDLILIFTYNTHLQAFPVSVFRDRIKRLVNALKTLFGKKPNATVLFKGSHITNDSKKWFDSRLSLLYTEILFEEFTSIRDNVRYLDVFTISALNGNHQLHPVGETLKHQLQQFLSYVCP